MRDNMSYDFDQVVKRRGTDSVKWSYFGAGCAAHVGGRYGLCFAAAHYRRAPGPGGRRVSLAMACESVRLREILVERMARLYHVDDPA